MEQEIIDMVQMGVSVDDNEFSVINLFWQADIIVKIVMVILIFTSIWCWAIIFQKLALFAKMRRLASKFEDAFWSGLPLDDLYDRIGKYPSDPMSAIFIAAMREWRRSGVQNSNHNNNTAAGLKDRIDRVMIVTMSREIERLERYLSFLASVGSSAPFIGLFGTVWGIMNSFANIAATKQTSIAVVAPGIAEALFATALGLVAAIPATIAYNKISTDLNRYAGRLEAFSGEFSAIISRQLDEVEE